jgi:hypothetical protein
MGGDSAATCNGIVGYRAAGKVYRRGEFLMGGAGSTRAQDLLRYSFEPPPPSEDLDAYMTRDFAAAMRKVLEENGRLAEDNEGYKTFGSRLLVGVRGRLYEIDPAFAIHCDACEYNAIGSGCEIALGVMYATEKLAWKPEERIRLALRAAEHWTTDVRGPFTVLVTE